MTDATKLGPWVRRFLLEHLVDERNLARNTQRSYRDTLTLLVPFIANKVRKEVDQLTVGDITAKLVQMFPARPGADAWLLCLNTQSTAGRDPCAGALYRGT
jgi:site-specific recombinase XerD